MMAPRSILALLSIVAAVSAFSVQPTAVRPSTVLKESFGFDFAEDSYENTPIEILGEANYKAWVGKIDENSFLNRQYNIIRRVRELDLLQTTVDSGLLSSLEAQGVDLVTIEKLLPIAEELGLLSVAANNQQLIVNLAAFFLVEGAPFLLPPIAGAVKVGPVAFYGASAALIGLDAFLLVNHVDIPFVGLSAGFYLGLLLIPLAGISGIVGTTLAGLNK